MELSLPRACLIADRFTERRIQNRVIEAVEAGIRWVQLRDHDADEHAFRSAAERLIPRLWLVDPNILISINARLDVAVEFGTAFHTGRRGPGLGEVVRLGVPRPVGYSVHSVDEAREITRFDPDYLIFSPIFETRSKPDARPAGLASLKIVSEAAAPVPVYALGGVNAQNAHQCLRSGAGGIAAISAILGATDVSSAARDLLMSLDESLRR